MALRISPYNKKVNMKRLAILLSILVLFAFPVNSYADVAPPYNPPGSNVDPGSVTTQVRMMAETVLVDVLADTTPNSLGKARVTAEFTMNNTGSESEQLAVRFPISADDGRGGYPEITNLIIKVDGQQIPYRRVDYPDAQSGRSVVPWAEFDINFPLGQDVGIEVAYDLLGSGYSPYTAYYYVLHTGAGWKDTIGSADITLRLPYSVDAQNVVFNYQIGWAETTPGGVIKGNEVQWHFENFEPGDQVPDMEFALISPSAWQAILTQRDYVSRNPNDGEAWGRLAKTYKEIDFIKYGFREDTGGDELYQLSVEAYEKCLALLPNDAQWHARFAGLLAQRDYWDVFSSGVPTANTLRAFDEIRTALQLAPNDSKVLGIAANINLMYPDGMLKNGTGYDYLWLTQTPLPSTPKPVPTQTEIPTPIPTLVPASTNSPQPTSNGQPTPTAKPSSPICGEAALLPLAVAIWLKRKSIFR